MHHFLCNQCRTSFSSLIEVLRSEFGNVGRVFSVDPLKENPGERRPLSDFQSALKAATSKFCAGNPSTNGWKKTLKYRMHKMNIRKIKRSKSSTPRQPKCRLVVFVYVCGLSHGHLGLPKYKNTFKSPFFFLDIFVCELD